MNISVALGGGGARGLAHVGVLNVLDREGFRVRAIAGTSMGGIIAAFYACGYRGDELVRIVEDGASRDLLHARPRDGGLLGLDRIESILEDYIGDRQFADLEIPLAVTATNLDTGCESVITHGGVVEGVMATIALPGIFPPVHFGGARLVDGGAIDPVPVAPARHLYNGPVVASVLSPSRENWDIYHSPPNPLLNAFPILERVNQLRSGTALTIFMRTIEISARMFTELKLELDQPEVVVRPEAWSIGLFDRQSAAKTIAYGEKAMEEALPELQAQFNFSKILGRGIKRVVGSTE
jgi:NTE family protein